MAKKSDKEDVLGKYSTGIERRSGRSRIIAALLAIFLGGIGIHKFYLGQIGWGLLYILFVWTSIPIIIGILEGLMFLFMSDKSFEAKYS